MTYSLRVVSQQAIVGRLTYEPHHGLAGRYSFAYDPTWLRRDDRFPLSPHLPLRGAPGDPDTVARFLANLLPEGRALEVAAAHHHIAKSNTFALIRLLGKEPVGALSFVPEDGSSSDPAEEQAELVPEKREISREELNQRIADRNRDVPFPVWDGKVRLSVADFQDKLQVGGFRHPYRHQPESAAAGNGTNGGGSKQHCAPSGGIGNLCWQGARPREAHLPIR
ncbi:HipA N-terminal domain-containing protein [Cupriavidus gilardii]|uniref:HipA N-terminal domain-containing protein n=1 Tax=Cupriavidus gilardii TaxID=82541 RepID=UPI0021BE7121|nr:HipA N-terminal domain-containing protein [Cupriavidus gilardii]MCT9127178.1 HipA N-terminal domain-containing protein [Cupriavidus gilardii]